MANWVKFSDRLPTEDDLDYNGKLMFADKYGFTSYTRWDCGDDSIVEHYMAYRWLENIPPLPKPRTLEDVVKEYLYHAGNTIQRLALQDEMLDILERKDDERY